MDAIFKKLKKIISKRAQISEDTIKLKSGFHCNLGIGSMTLSFVISDIEQEFSININYDEAEKKIKIVKNCYDIIKEKINKQGRE